MRPPSPRSIALPPDFPGPPSLLGQRLFGIQLALVFAGIALVVGLLIPAWLPEGLLRETGPIERSTIWVYFAAVLCVLLVRWPGRSMLDAGAASVLLLAMAAREADLHTALFGTSILKLRFYTDTGSAAQILTALAILLPVVAAGLWLVWRHGMRWLRAPSRWTAPMVSVSSMAGAMVFAKIMDRTPVTLGQLHLLERTPQALLLVMLSMEEILEFALPLFAIVAVLQCRGLALQRRPLET